jgi:hypothetical protein
MRLYSSFCILQRGIWRFSRYIFGVANAPSTVVGGTDENYCALSENQLPWKDDNLLPDNMASQSRSRQNMYVCSQSQNLKQSKQIPWLLVRKRTIPTERPTLVGEFRANVSE